MNKWDLDVAEGQDKNNVKKIFLKRRNYQEGLVPHFVYIVSTFNYNFENMYMYANSLNQLLFSTTLICNLPKIN